MKIGISEMNKEFTKREYKILWFGILMGLNIGWLFRYEITNPFAGVLILSVTIASLVVSLFTYPSRVKRWIES